MVERKTSPRGQINVVGEQADGREPTISSIESSAQSGVSDGDETLEPGTVAGNYVIEGLLGVGGGGIVYFGTHQVIKRRAAIKVLRRHLTNSPPMVARFVREASAVSMIGHPNIVDVYEFDELPDGRPFYVMELIDGVNLRQLLETCGRLSPSEALDLIEPICKALSATHAAGIVHRDLKASNVLVTEREGERTIKLVDFGVAKLLHVEPGEVGLTGPGAVLGSVHTMSPEQILCESPDTRSDIYSMGVLLFQLVTGRLPFQGKTEEVAMLHLAGVRPKPSEHAPVPHALDAVVLRAMQRDPENRHPTVAAFLEDLRRAVLGDRLTGEESTSSRLAIGIYIFLRSDDVDSDALDDMGVILDSCEQTLGSSKFALPLQGSDSMLAIKVLALPADACGQACRDTKLVASRLVEQLVSRPGANPNVHITVGLHVNFVDCHEKNGEIEIVGGPLLEVDAWARSDADGLYVSDDFAAAAQE